MVVYVAGADWWFCISLNFGPEERTRQEGPLKVGWTVCLGSVLLLLFKPLFGTRRK